MNKDLYNLLKHEYYKRKFDQLEEVGIEYFDDSFDYIDD